MADPGTLMAVAAATQAVGALASGNSQAAQHDAQAQAAAWNASMQREQASVVAQQTSAREDLQRKQARQVLGRQIAAGAESGVNITGGSAADVFRSSLYDAEMDALNIRYEGELNRGGLLTQANLSDWEGQVAKANSKSAVRSGYLNAASSLASAAAGAYGAKAGAASVAPVAGTGLKPGGGLGLRVGGGLGLR